MSTPPRPAVAGESDRVAATDVERAHRLAVELTESIMIDSLDAAAERMRALKALGTRIALDDFGTGFSSLSYLKRLPPA